MATASGHGKALAVAGVLALAVIGGGIWWMSRGGERTAEPGATDNGGEPDGGGGVADNSGGPPAGAPGQRSEGPMAPARVARGPGRAAPQHTSEPRIFPPADRAWNETDEAVWTNTSHAPVTTVKLAELPWKREILKMHAAYVMLAEAYTLTDPPPAEVERAAAEKADAFKGVTIELKADFEGGFLPLVQKISETHFTLDFQNQQAQMFLFRVKGAAGKAVRIDFMNIDMNLWHSLNPVMSDGVGLGDLASFAPIETFNLANPARANNGPLIPDGRVQRWSYMPGVWSEGEFALCVTQRFEKDDVFVAAKVPYTVAYNDAYLKKMGGGNYAKVVKIGDSAKGRALQVVEIGEGTPEERKNKPCIVMYAREHPAQHDTSWVEQGAIDFLMGESAEAKGLRKKCEFLMIPMLDPDAAATETTEGILSTFMTERKSAESVKYAAWFKQWVDAGNRLDIVINLQNVLSAESPHLDCPAADAKPLQRANQLEILRRLCERLSTEGLTGSEEAGLNRAPPTRLGVWLSDTYGTLHTPYEVNSQQERLHLTMDQLRQMGRDLILETAGYLTDGSGTKLLAATDDVRKAYAARWAQYGKGIPAADPFMAERLVLRAQQTATRPH